MKTLISFVGKGQVLKGTDVHAYLKTRYDFGGGVTYETSCFADAIRLSGRYAFDEVLFIGSCTSSWSTLLEQDPDAEDLFLELYDRGENKIPLGDKEEELKQTLEKLWGKPVRLCVTVPELLADNSEDILNKYISALLDSNQDVLLDITHGFRWMPVLLTSVLQLANSYRHGAAGNIEVIYGELNRDAVISPVRYLDILIKGQKISDAVALFFQKFEAEPLAELLAPYWESGADAIRKFGLNIQGNYFLPLLIDPSEENFPVGRPVAQLKNALKNFPPDPQPAWVVNVHKRLGKIVKELTAESARLRLLNLAGLLAECSYYGQAILLVCLAMEQDLMETMGCMKHPGYEGVRYLQDVFIKEEKKKKYSPFVGCFFDIKKLRNRIAHGGLPDTGSPTMLQAESLKDQYSRILRKQQELHTYLEKTFEVPEEVEKQMKAGQKPWK